jgi:hypothetical protein
VTVAAAGSGTNVESVYVDAADGSVVFSYSELHDAKSRLICDLGNASVNLNDPSTYVCSDAAGGPPLVRREGGAPTAVTDVNQAYDMLGAVYDFYLNNFGRDSVDGYGLPLRATVRACDPSFACPYQNAFWDGTQMVFGQGFAAADDVVAHELTHGVTDYTSQLYYFAESGGINEALSDIMGEFFDQTLNNDDDSQWLIGETLPGIPGGIRSMKDPTLFNDPSIVDDTSGSLWSNALNDVNDNYGVHSLSGVVNHAAYLLAAGGSQNGQDLAGIGIPKSMQIWYRLMFLLPSGAEMADLVTLLPYACRSIIGVAGITSADCIQAGQATLATGMNLPTGFDAGGFSRDDASDCGSAGMPSRTILSDDFERGAGRWTLDSSWQLLPDASTPVSYANSGKFALYADVNNHNTVRPLATLNQWITPPASGLGNVRVSWAENVLTNTNVGGVDVMVASQGGSQVSTGVSTFYLSKGYAKRVASLSAIPNQPFKIIIAAQSSATVENAVLVDDVRVYECEPGVNGPPERVAADLGAGGTSATVSWSGPIYTAPGAGPANYEVSVLPAPAGYTGPITVASNVFSAVITGLNPTVRYQIIVRALNSSGAGGVGAMTFVPTFGAVSCKVLDTGGNRNQCSSVPQLPPLGR